jgi:hypothetical protein
MAAKISCTRGTSRVSLGGKSRMAANLLRKRPLTRSKSAWSACVLAVRMHVNSGTTNSTTRGLRDYEGPKKKKKKGHEQQDKGKKGERHLAANVDLEQVQHAHLEVHRFLVGLLPLIGIAQLELLRKGLVNLQHPAT